MRYGKRIALSGVMCALGVALMSLGGFIPLATFCSPAIAGLCLLPIFVECGERLSWGAWLVVSALSLMFSPDKEAALLFCFIGYYPILKWRLDQIRSTGARVLTKLLLFNLAVVAMYALCLLVLRMEYLLKEYREAGVMMALICLLLGNAAMLLYDRLVNAATIVYVRRLRDRIK